MTWVKYEANWYPADQVHLAGPRYDYATLSRIVVDGLRTTDALRAWASLLSPDRRSRWQRLWQEDSPPEGDPALLGDDPVTYVQTYLAAALREGGGLNALQFDLRIWHPPDPDDTATVPALLEVRSAALVLAELRRSPVLRARMSQVLATWDARVEAAGIPPADLAYWVDREIGRRHDYAGETFGLYRRLGWPGEWTWPQALRAQGAAPLPQDEARRAGFADEVLGAGLREVLAPQRDLLDALYGPKGTGRGFDIGDVAQLQPRLLAVTELWRPQLDRLSGLATLDTPAVVRLCCEAWLLAPAMGLLDAGGVRTMARAVRAAASDELELRSDPDAFADLHQILRDPVALAGHLDAAAPPRAVEPPAPPSPRRSLLPVRRPDASPAHDPAAKSR